MPEYQAAAATVIAAATAWDHVSRHGSRTATAGTDRAVTPIPADAVAASVAAEAVGGSWTLTVGATRRVGGDSNSGADDNPSAPRLDRVPRWAPPLPSRPDQEQVVLDQDGRLGLRE